MADVGIFTKNADIQARAGANANATAKAVAATDVYVLNIESFINCTTRYNWSDWFAGTPNADVKGILTDCGACLCAMIVINYDMSGFSSRAEAETMLDVLRDRAVNDLKLLEDIKVQEFMIGA